MLAIFFFFLIFLSFLPRFRLKKIFFPCPNFDLNLFSFTLFAIVAPFLAHFLSNFGSKLQFSAQFFKISYFCPFLIFLGNSTYFFVSKLNFELFFLIFFPLVKIYFFGLIFVFLIFCHLCTNFNLKNIIFQ